MGTRTKVDMDATILLVDDEENVRRMLSDYLSLNGFEVVPAGDAVAALAYLADNSPDLVILDVQMPGQDGFDVCRQIRTTSTYIPVLMISGVRRETVDRIVGLEIGADKYLTKPFELPVLLAEVRSLLRMAQASNSVGNNHWLVVDEYLQIDRQRRTVRVAGRTPHLTVLELDLLLYLMDHEGRPVSRDDIVESVWKDTSGGVSDLAVNSCVARLRKKIERDPTNPTYIQSVYGWGYRFCDCLR